MEVQSVLDLGSSGPHLMCFNINLEYNVVEEQIFCKKYYVPIQLNIKNRMIPENVQEQVILGIKELINESNIKSNTKIVAFATAWSRASENNFQLIDKIKTETGINVKIINQETEGRIGYASVLLKRYQINETARIIRKGIEEDKLFSWDIGGGSMQITKHDQVYGSVNASATFANAVIEMKGSSDNTPNPLTKQEIELATKLSYDKAKELIDNTLTENCIMIGIGFNHKNNLLFINRLLGIDNENYYEMSDLQRVVHMLTNKDNEHLSSLLNIKLTEVRNKLTTMILILGHMKYMNVERVYVTDILSGSGALFIDL